MALSVFDDKSQKPRADDLKSVLGRASAHWNALIAHIAAEHTPLEETWSFSGASWGWALRLRHKKRTVLYMTPCKKHFLVGFALGEKAVAAARDSALPDSVVAMIDDAKKYPEGRAVRLEIRNKKDLENAKQLAAIKMAS
jgi:hypothetical protein